MLQPLDLALVPVMYWLQGNRLGTPQGTRAWNNRELTSEERALLRRYLMVEVEGVEGASPRTKWGLPTAHMPRFGGWQDFVVVDTFYSRLGEAWYPGWVTDDVAGVSLLPLYTPVRLLIGPNNSSFFGVSAYEEQCKVALIGRGTINDPGDWGHLPLR